MSGISWSDLGFDRPQVMAILNVTPDSFADGGELYGRLETVIDRAAQYLHSGASILDIGGESTRPGASPVSEAEELDRVIPVVEAIKSRFDCFVSMLLWFVVVCVIVLCSLLIDPLNYLM